MKNPNLIILAGITGLDKKKFVTKLLKKAKKTKNVLVIDFEEELVNEERNPPMNATDMQTFLNNSNLTAKLELVKSNFSWIAEKINGRSEKITYIILCIHLSYFRNSEFYPPFVFEYIREILTVLDDSEIKIITLIDDVFALWQKINDRENKYPKTKLTLYEILIWRSLELLRAQELRENIRAQRPHRWPLKHFIVSVRHPISVFNNLIFKKHPKIIYLSYHISSTRDNPKDIKDINNFRNKMYKLAEKEGWVIFDPVAIDELAIKTAFDKTETKAITLKHTHRWPLGHSDLLIDEEKFPLRLPRDEIPNAINAIKSQIKSRDYMLVDTSTCLVVYRPWFNGKPSQGVDAEIKRANAESKKVLVFDPAIDHNSNAPTTHPFSDEVEQFPTIDGLLKRLYTVGGTDRQVN